MSVTLCPWDDGGGSDSEEDDWLFSSLSLYNQLLMFHLTVQAGNVDLPPSGNTLVVGDRDKQELVVYRLPSKLMAGSKEQEGLTSNRDFGLVAGTVDAGKVKEVKFMGEERLVTCREGGEGVDVWGWGEEDLLVRREVLDKCGFEPEVLAVREGECLLGGGNLVGKRKLEDGAWKCRKLDGKGDICSLYSEGDSEVVWVGQTGAVVSCVDWRVEGVARQLKLGGADGDRWDTAFLPHRDSVGVVGVSSAKGGCVGLWDTRQASTPVCQKPLHLPPTLCRADSVPQVVAECGTVLLSMGHTVSVFNPANLKMLFQHEGHKQKDQVVNVTSLAIHPTVERLVISGDSRQRLHAWIFNPDAKT